MSRSLALATAATSVWLGIVIAISFPEAPLKIRAPDVTLPIGLGNGRLVFRALSIAEPLLAGVLADATTTSLPRSGSPHGVSPPKALIPRRTHTSDTW